MAMNKLVAHYLIVNKREIGYMHGVFCTDDPRSAAVYMLGRCINDYIIVKSDETGDRIVPMVPEVSKLEVNCIDA